jgi:hypothetical protein
MGYLAGLKILVPVRRSSCRGRLSSVKSGRGRVETTRATASKAKMTTKIAQYAMELKLDLLCVSHF